MRKKLAFFLYFMSKYGYYYNLKFFSMIKKSDEDSERNKQLLAIEKKADWLKFKVEYVTNGENIFVSDFLISKGIAPRTIREDGKKLFSDLVKQRTRGWKKQKLKYNQAEFDDALERHKIQNSEELDKTYGNTLQILTKYVNASLDFAKGGDLQSLAKMKNIDIVALQKVSEMLLTGQKKPTKYTKTEIKEENDTSFWNSVQDMCENKEDDDDIDNGQLF